jgi:hypothetical protein
MSATKEKAPADWITTIVSAALETSPVAAAVTTEIEKQLNGTMRERALRAAEIAELAKNLLAAVNDSPLGKGPAP